MKRAAAEQAKKDTYVALDPAVFGRRWQTIVNQKFDEFNKRLSEHQPPILLRRKKELREAYKQHINGFYDAAKKETFPSNFIGEEMGKWINKQSEFECNN